MPDSATLESGVWHHLVWHIEGTDVTFYMDGNEVRPDDH